MAEIELTAAFATRKLGWRVRNEAGDVVRSGESDIGPDSTFPMPPMSDLPIGTYTVETDPIEWERD